MSELDDLISEALSITVEPSPMFARRVMFAIHRETELPPLPFPWLRIAIAALLLIVMIVAGVHEIPATIDATGSRVAASDSAIGGNHEIHRSAVPLRIRVAAVHNS